MSPRPQFFTSAQAFRLAPLCVCENLPIWQVFTPAWPGAGRAP
jgi:hypothetical protein